jgi:hypothetical protein
MAGHWPKPEISFKRAIFETLFCEKITLCRHISNGTKKNVFYNRGVFEKDSSLPSRPPAGLKWIIRSPKHLHRRRIVGYSSDEKRPYFAHLAALKIRQYSAKKLKKIRFGSVGTARPRTLRPRTARPSSAQTMPR